MSIYRKIYEQYFGPVPKDKDGRTYEIHHIDGNRKNNDISNLKAVSIQEHYNIHYTQGDFGACVMIAKRMQLPPDHLSKIQKGCKRPGIGGRKKGTPSWNKGISGYRLNVSEKGKNNIRIALKKRSKISDQLAEQIREDHKNKVAINNPKIGKVMQNGKIMTYNRAFCLEYAEKYGVTPTYINRIIKKLSKIK